MGNISLLNVIVLTRLEKVLLYFSKMFNNKTKIKWKIHKIHPRKIKFKVNLSMNFFTISYNY